MADSNDTRLADLKARAAVRGYELVTDDSGDKDRYYAFDAKDRILAASPMTLAKVSEWLDSAEADDRAHGEGGKSGLAELRRAALQAVIEAAGRTLADETDGGYKPVPGLMKALGDLEHVLDEVDDDDATPLERARDAAQTAAYDVRFLVEAALTLNQNGADDGPLERVLETAKEKLVALANDLDSVTWPKSSVSGGGSPAPSARDVLRAAGDPFSAVSLCVEQAQAIADMLQLSTETNEPADGSITVAAGMVYNHMQDARRHLDALWVALGGSERHEHNNES